MLDFESDDTHLLLNPRLPPDERARLEQMHAAAPPLRAHGAPVGGGWNPQSFIELCDSERVTLASLVPAQIRDLLGLRVPASLRGIVVGGGALAPELYEAAADWPLLPSYGMTETASQVATARLGSPDLLLLDHVEARTEDSRIALRGESLLTGYMEESGRPARPPGAGGTPALQDPKHDGWFVTPDIGSIEGRVLRVAGRAGDFVKIGGESVDLSRLDRILAAIEPNAAIVAVRDERLGFVIHLAIASGDSDRVVAAFNERVLPFDRIRAVHQVDAIPRTSLGKLRRTELARALGI